MNRKLIGIGSAIVLAVVGTVGLVGYVSNAEDRALEGEELVEVYVVVRTIPAGTDGDEVEAFVAVEQIPVKVQALGAVSSLASLGGRVASIDLLPGEQLVAGRFVNRSDLTDRAVGVQVPDDLVEVTIQLDPAQAIGGLIDPGQHVAVFASFEPFELVPAVVEVDGEEIALPEAIASSVQGKTPNTTDIILRKILVTAVQRVTIRSAGGEGDTSRFDTAPEDALLVTLAVDPHDAERLVFTAEFGLLWLAIDRESVPEVSDPAQSRESIYESAEAGQP